MTDRESGGASSIKLIGKPEGVPQIKVVNSEADREQIAREVKEASAKKHAEIIAREVEEASQKLEADLRRAAEMFRRNDRQREHIAQEVKDAYEKKAFDMKLSPDDFSSLTHPDKRQADAIEKANKASEEKRPDFTKN